MAQDLDAIRRVRRAVWKVELFAERGVSSSTPRAEVRSLAPRHLPLVSLLTKIPTPTSATAAVGSKCVYFS